MLDKFLHAGVIMITADKPDWLDRVRETLDKPSITLDGPPTVRAAAWDQPHKTIVHLLNLDIKRLSSFEDRVTGVQNIGLVVRVGTGKTRRCRALTADSEGTSGPLKFSILKKGKDTFIETSVPRLEIATVLVLD